MGKKYLIDTNILIDAQSRKLPEDGLRFLETIIDSDFKISFITYIEFLGYSQITSAAQDFIALADVIEINKSIMDACIELRKAQRIKLPDAIIAATAMVGGFTLISNNTADFNKIAGLQLIDLHNS